MDNKDARIKLLRTVVSLVLVGLYVLGLIAMMTFSFQTGLILWVVSTLGGIGLLYWIRTAEKQREALAKSGAEEDAGDAGTDEGAGE